MSKILLVEDDNNLREIYEARLQAEGYTIVSARDGEEALVVAKAEKPDLIISDIMMPKISGFEMLDILRNTEGLKDVKVIMLTALGQSDDQQRADKLGADRYLVKSQVTLEDIIKAAYDLLSEDQGATPPLPTVEATPEPTTPQAAPTTAPAPAAPTPAHTPAPAPMPVATPPPAAPTPPPPSPTPTPPATPPGPAQDTPQAPPTPAPAPAAPAPAPSKPAAPASSSSSAVTTVDDKLMNDAVNALIADTEKKTAAKPEQSDSEKSKSTDAEPSSSSDSKPENIVVTSSVESQEKDAEKETKTAIDAPAEEDDESTSHVPIAHKKIIKPLDSKPKKDINTLLAEEEAKEAAGDNPSLTTAASTADEEAEVDAKIEDFVAGATTEPTPPPAPKSKDDSSSESDKKDQKPTDPNIIAL